MGYKGTLPGIWKGLLLAACFVAGFFLQQPVFAQKHSVRLMTYNVGAFGKEMDDSAPMIARMIADRTDKSLFKELEECLYHIKACAQNEFNSDYWRVFYNALCKITEQEETK